MERFMSGEEPGRSDETTRYLVAASKAIVSIRYCWLATVSKSGLTDARPMGCTPRELDEDQWKIRFVTDGRSHKVSEIQDASEVAVIFQRDADDAYLTFSGKAAIRTGASEDRRHWRDAYNVYFPGDDDRKNAAFIEVQIDHMKLWIRGVTPEPFGLRPTVLERDVAGSWLLVS
jgi:general stress protein 26